MKKIMISQPMNGFTDEQIVETRNRFLEYTKRANLEVVNTYFTDEWYSKDSMTERGVVQIPLCFLAKAVENMSLCHIAYFAKGWQNARGCKIEHEIAKQYGLEIIYEDTLYNISEIVEAPPIQYDFGNALRILKDGYKVARLGWNGNNMYAVLQKGYPDGIAINKNTSDAIGMPEGTVCKFRPYFLLKTAQNDFAHWVPSGSDILAEDWIIVE